MMRVVGPSPARLRTLQSSRDPFRQKLAQKGKNLHFSRGFDPLAPFLLAGGGGWQSRNMLDVRAFLAFRQLPALAQWPVTEGVPHNAFSPCF
jgi:hypothetical protein